ncbi:protein DMP4-like protein [Cinnamomum micranthum f. kanehirae]|uniref:Protein DMP4-like protein n=1 Tax=Cinnamomum micranthum f. kanehirae TaxID=337451 RepID=A0A443PFN9_9MAGN|nr:protein DMP4-like protein [Cinnamomum micranthum f. kanehirae]
MKIKVGDEEEAQRQQPLLHKEKSIPPQPPAWQDQKTLIQRLINQTFQSTAHLANLLPTGTVLAFQLLSPIFTNQGHCDSAGQNMTVGLIALCGLSCFFSSFTDSFRDGNGKVHYGIATRKGLLVIDAADSSELLSPEEAARYRLTLCDFIHSFLSILVFVAVALFDQNVVGCFYPEPSDETSEVLTVLPVGIGVISSMLFVAFPTNRHGIGFPLSAR